MSDRWSPGEWLHDAVAAALRQRGLAVTGLSARPAAMARSARLTEVHVALADRAGFDLMCKEPLVAAPGQSMPAGKPDFVRDPERHYWTDPATPAVSDYARHRITRRDFV